MTDTVEKRSDAPLPSMPDATPASGATPAPVETRIASISASQPMPTVQTPPDLQEPPAPTRPLVPDAAPAQAAATAAGTPIVFEHFPKTVDITYVLKGLVRVEHHWQVDADRYRIDTKGSLFGIGLIEMKSDGQLDGSGLRPTHYAFYGSNGEPRFEVNFDWAAHVAHFGANALEKDVPLADGAQDIFSAAYQFALLGDRMPDSTLQIFTNRKEYRVAFALKGETRLYLSGTPVPVLVLSGAIDQKRVEFYLAPQWHNLPVRILWDDGGQKWDLVAAEVSVDGQPVLAPPSHVVEN